VAKQPDCISTCQHPSLCQSYGDCVGQYGYRTIVTDQGPVVVPAVLDKQKDRDRQERARRALRDVLSKGMIKPQPVVWKPGDAT